MRVSLNVGRESWECMHGRDPRGHACGFARFIRALSKGVRGAGALVPWSGVAAWWLTGDRSQPVAEVVMSTR
jgi:hypothetical protein